MGVSGGGHGRAYARTPDKNVEANVKARSACVNSPNRGGPAGCASTLSFEIRNPAPRSSFFFLLTAAGTGGLDADWLAGVGFGAVAFFTGGLAAGDLVTTGFFVAVAGDIFHSWHTSEIEVQNVEHDYQHQ